MFEEGFKGRFKRGFKDGFKGRFKGGFKRGFNPPPSRLKLERFQVWFQGGFKPRLSGFGLNPPPAET